MAARDARCLRECTISFFIAIFVRDSARYECQVSRNVGDLAEMCIDPSIYRISLLYVILYSIRSLLSWFQIFRSFSLPLIFALA